MNTSFQRLVWILLALAAGAVLPIQGAVNGLLRSGLHAPFAVALTSFVFVATLAMGGVLLIAVFSRQVGTPAFDTVPLMSWWGWLGGMAGAIYVTTVFTAMPVIGTATTVGFTIAGQQITSVLVDRDCLLRLPRRSVSDLRPAGVVTPLVGVTAIKFL